MFKTVTGLSFWEFLARRRIARVKELLRDSGRTIKDIADEVGFRDITHFSRVLRKIERLLPSEFRRLAKPASRPPGMQPGAAQLLSESSEPNGTNNESANPEVFCRRPAKSAPVTPRPAGNP